MMDREIDVLTALLLDPFLTSTEAEREAASQPRRATASRSRRGAMEHSDVNHRVRPETPSLDF